MSVTNGKIGIIGAGVMGKTMAKGILGAKLVPPSQLWATAKTTATCQKVKQDLGITVTTNYKPLLAETDVLLLCVKPSGLQSVLEDLRNNGLKPDTLVISIIAGKTLSYIESRIQQKNPVIRAMPNTPCMVGQGMTVICAGAHAKGTHMKLAQAIFDSTGETMTLDEKHFDAVTALVGSGPAYMYLIMEALADGGVRVGLPRDAALRLVAQTVLGAATMVERSGRHPAALRDDVTTPAGCTIGALLTMEDGKIRSVLARAVEEATHIAHRLGQDEDNTPRRRAEDEG